MRPWRIGIIAVAAIVGVVLLTAGQTALGLVALAGGALVLVIRSAGRYDRTPHTRSVWDALDAGEDPTLDDPGPDS